jgi:hypothetical protein
MAASKTELWQRFQKYHTEFPSLGPHFVSHFLYQSDSLQLAAYFTDNAAFNRMEGVFPGLALRLEE